MSLSLLAHLVHAGRQVEGRNVCTLDLVSRPVRYLVLSAAVQHDVALSTARQRRVVARTAQRQLAAVRHPHRGVVPDRLLGVLECLEGSHWDTTDNAHARVYLKGNAVVGGETRTRHDRHQADRQLVDSASIA